MNTDEKTFILLATNTKNHQIQERKFIHKVSTPFYVMSVAKAVTPRETVVGHLLLMVNSDC